MCGNPPIGSCPCDLCQCGVSLCGTNPTNNIVSCSDTNQCPQGQFCNGVFCVNAC
jgi:hypothetical protein